MIAIWVPQTPGSVNLFKEMGFEPADNKLNIIGKIAHCIQEKLMRNDSLYILPSMTFLGNTMQQPTNVAKCERIEYANFRIDQIKKL